MGIISIEEPFRKPRRLRHLAAGLIATIMVLAWAAPESYAQRRGRPQASSFSANKTFGLGFMIGAPTAFVGKYYLGADTAFDFGIGAYSGFRRGRGIHLHADFLWHPAVLAVTDPFVLPLYFGLGARLFDDYGDDDFGLGVRVPGGIIFDFNRVPLDIFIELSFVLDFFLGGRGGVDGDLGLAVGVRYYFN